MSIFAYFDHLEQLGDFLEQENLPQQKHTTFLCKSIYANQKLMFLIMYLRAAGDYFFY